MYPNGLGQFWIAQGVSKKEQKAVEKCNPMTLFTGSLEKVETKKHVLRNIIWQQEINCLKIIQENVILTKVKVKEFIN